MTVDGWGEHNENSFMDRLGILEFDTSIYLRATESIKISGYNDVRYLIM